MVCVLRVVCVCSACVCVVCEVCGVCVVCVGGVCVVGGWLLLFCCVCWGGGVVVRCVVRVCCVFVCSIASVSLLLFYFFMCISMHFDY